MVIPPHWVQSWAVSCEVTAFQHTLSWLFCVKTAPDVSNIFRYFVRYYLINLNYNSAFKADDTDNNVLEKLSVNKLLEHRFLFCFKAEY